jgi:hypothetical protein
VRSSSQQQQGHDADGNSPWQDPGEISITQMHEWEWSGPLPVGETGTGLAMGGRGNVSVSAFLFSAHQRGIASAWGASAGSATLADQTIVNPRRRSSRLDNPDRHLRAHARPGRALAGRWSPLSRVPAEILWSGRLPALAGSTSHRHATERGSYNS